MFAASLGSGLCRNEVDVDLAATDAVARLAGTTLARGAQHLDTTIRIEHSMPRGTSSQEFKAVVDGRAHAVFQGRIRVAPDAQKTDAQQVSRSLLLSSTAAADTKPELEILADDVKCSHGATIGDLDEEALFYLRARGVGEAEARKMLVDAFIGELIEHITVDTARAYFRRAFDHWLADGVQTMTAIQPITAARTLDVARIRQDFPILSRPVRGKRLVFLDSAASAQKPRSVMDAERDIYEAGYANVHRGVYWLSQHATDAFEAAREKVRQLLNARETREIVFVRGATEAINLVAQSFGRAFLSAGRRGADQPHGAPFEYRALADAARGEGRRIESGADRRCGRAGSGRLRKADRTAHQADRGYACRQCTRHGRAD